MKKLISALQEKDSKLAKKVVEAVKTTQLKNKIKALAPDKSVVNLSKEIIDSYEKIQKVKLTREQRKELTTRATDMLEDAVNNIYQVFFKEYTK